MESKGSTGKILKKKAGYEYLLAYKISVPLYDYTVVFCRRHWKLLSSSRTQDQMVQASRSGMTNIPEGNQQASLEGYIKLTGVSSASLEELLKDYLSFARQNKLEIWGKERVVREIRELGEVWDIIRENPYLPDSPDFPDLPGSLTEAVNFMITLTNQAIYLQKRLKASLEKKFIKEGGFRENLFLARRNALHEARMNNTQSRMESLGGKKRIEYKNQKGYDK